MKKNKHTRAGTIFITSKIHNHRVSLAEVTQFENDKKTRANASLLAASPDLLQAAANAFKVIKQLTTKLHGPLPKEVLKELSDAIRKAGGNNE